MPENTARSKPFVIIAAIALLVAGLAAGCNFSLDIQPQVRTGWVGSQMPGLMDYRYASFTGNESAKVYADADQQIEVSYQAIVEKGTLTLEIRDPDREIVLAHSFAEDDEGTYTLPVDQKGNFQIQVVGRNTAGRFKLVWNVD